MSRRSFKWHEGPGRCLGGRSNGVSERGKGGEEDKGRFHGKNRPQCLDTHALLRVNFVGDVVRNSDSAKAPARNRNSELHVTPRQPEPACEESVRSVTDAWHARTETAERKMSRLKEMLQEALA